MNRVSSESILSFFCGLTFLLLGIDRYGFFRGDTDTDFFLSALAEDRHGLPIFGADTTFAPSIYIIKFTQRR